MWQRFTLDDVRVIGHYLGMLVLFSTLVYAVPLLTAVIFAEWEPASRYLIATGITLIVGSALRFLRIEPGRLNRQQALVVTGLAWIVLSFIASFPLYGSGHYATYLDALFDGVSGYTTTGATLILDLDHLSNADNMLRFMMHLVGGLGLIVIALSLGLFGKRSGASLYSSEGRSEHVVPNVVQTTRFIAKVAIVFIILGTTALLIMTLLLGMEPSRAFMQSLWLSISAFITGGFAPMSQSVMYYHSFSIEIVLMVLMVLGSVNFVLHAEIGKGRVMTFFRDLDTRTIGLWLVAMTFVFAASLLVSSTFSDLPSMLRSLFLVVSAFSTTGFQNITTNEITTALSSGSFLVLAIIMAVGGAGGSTAGGIKINRVGIMLKSIIATIKEALSPDSARVVVDYYHVGRRQLTPSIVKEAMSVFMLFVVTYVIGALVGIAFGYEATQAIFESIAMASNGGITTGIASPGMPVPLELVYIFEMWAGRLEFITLLALISKIVVSLVPRRFLGVRAR